MNLDTIHFGKRIHSFCLIIYARIYFYEAISAEEVALYESFLRRTPEKYPCDIQ